MKEIRQLMPKIELKVITLELTNFCNLSCWMCSHKDMTRDIGYMDVDLIKKLSKELRNHNLDFISLHGIGESTVHPELREISEILRNDNPGLFIGLATNGTFLTRKTFDKIKGLIDLLSITIDAATKDTYDKHRKGGDFDRVVTNVNDILDYRKEININLPIIDIQFIDLGQTEKEKQDFVDYWTPKVLSKDKVRFLVKASFGGQVPIEFKIKACDPLFHQLSVLWDGRLTTCCWDSDAKNVMGDTNIDTIDDIWLSNKYSYMRELHRTRKLQKQKHLLCHTCLVP